MNALKLADDLDNANGFQYIAQLGLASQAAAMLRQQQAEIEALKAKLNKYHLKEDLDRNLNLIYGKELLK